MNDFSYYHAPTRQPPPPPRARKCAEISYLNLNLKNNTMVLWTDNLFSDTVIRKKLELAGENGIKTVYNLHIDIGRQFPLIWLTFLIEYRSNIELWSKPNWRSFLNLCNTCFRPLSKTFLAKISRKQHQRVSILKVKPDCKNVWDNSFLPNIAEVWTCRKQIHISTPPKITLNFWTVP